LRSGRKVSSTQRVVTRPLTKSSVREHRVVERCGRHRPFDLAARRAPAHALDGLRRASAACTISLPSSES
jgi:hypothetical protein